MPQRRASQTDRAYEYLRHEVIRGRWLADDIVSAYALAEELKISRTPVVEALKRLEAEGLVEIIPQVGCRILRPSARALDELLAVRAALEGLAAARAARGIDDDALAELELTLRRLDAAAAEGDLATYADLNQRFHLRIADASGMPRLAETVRAGVWTPLSYQLARLEVTDEQLRESGREHRELLQALRAHAMTRARSAAERHVRLAASRFTASTEPAGAEGLVHRALVYEDEASLLSAAVPFVTAGLDGNERVLVVTTPHNAEVLGRALGRQAGEVEFRDSDEWYQLPSHTLLSYERYIEQADRPRVRVVGEVAWDGGSRAPMSEWIRYESILNVAFARLPVSIVCPYDARRLPDRIVADARRTHPEVCSGDGAQRSHEFAETAALIRELDAEQLPEPEVPTTQRPITADHRAVREFVLDRAHHAGVHGKRLQDTFLAVGEVVASVDTGATGGGALIRSWVQDDELIYEVHGAAPWLGDSFAGRFPADPALLAEPGGLWMTRLLCDLVEARARDDGLLVRMHVALG